MAAFDQSRRLRRAARTDRCGFSQRDPEGARGGYGTDGVINRLAESRDRAASSRAMRAIGSACPAAVAASAVVAQRAAPGLALVGLSTADRRRVRLPEPPGATQETQETQKRPLVQSASVGFCYFFCLLFVVMF